MELYNLGKVDFSEALQPNTGQFDRWPNNSLGRSKINIQGCYNILSKIHCLKQNHDIPKPKSLINTKESKEARK
jgi:hypothetical protein